MIRKRPRGPCRRRLIVVGVIAAMVGAVPALADFVASGGENHTLSTDALAAPTGLALSPGSCSVGSQDRINLNWTATTSGWADSQEVMRSTTSGGPYTSVASLAPPANSFTNSNLSFNTTYYYVIRATKEQWTADSAEKSLRTRNSLCF